MKKNWKRINQELKKNWKIIEKELKENWKRIEKKLKKIWKRNEKNWKRIEKKLKKIWKRNKKKWKELKKNWKRIEKKIEKELKTFWKRNGNDLKQNWDFCPCKVPLEGAVIFEICKFCWNFFDHNVLHICIMKITAISSFQWCIYILNQYKLDLVIFFFDTSFFLDQVLIKVGFMLDHRKGKQNQIFGNRPKDNHTTSSR